jgi:hypothetical protein
MVTRADMGTDAAPTAARVLVTAMRTTLPADKPSPWACKSDQTRQSDPQCSRLFESKFSAIGLMS